ncbi:MAG: extracellular solute-binding protein [Spirochaetaceae bacterium]|nr:extracellular solute-binding protein [Spirochaetaceae bacterium]
MISAIMGNVFANGQQEAGSGVRPTLELLQNKPEIDPQLKAYAKAWGDANGVDVAIKTVGGSVDVTVGQMLTIGYAAGDLPDIFIFPGVDDYKQWAEVILDVSDQKWVDDTAVEFVYDGKVYGFPVAVEGWGMAYNAEILEAAGIDPAGLVNLEAYTAAFEKLDSMKAELGLDSVMSMAAAISMSWVTAHHNFNSLLSNGLAYGDLSVTNDLLAGKVDMDRLEQYASWVELLFTYADQSILVTGDYDAQVGSFAMGKSAFLHQGNWADGNIEASGASFERAFAPHGSMTEATDGIFVSAPSYYAINKDSKVVDYAKKFLNDLVYTDEGHNYMVNEAGMIPAFSPVTLSPSSPLSQSVQKWVADGKVYSWDQYYFSEDFRNNTLGPIYNQFAGKQINKAQFIDALNTAFESLK